MNFNTEKFPNLLVHQAIECIVFNRSKGEDPLSIIDFPQVRPLFVLTSSFYKAAQKFCEEIVLNQNIEYQKMIDEKHEDSTPFNNLKKIYPNQTNEELELLWLMIVENWDEFRTRIEREVLENTLHKVA